MMQKLKDLIVEKVEYYLDTSKENLDRYIAKDGNTLYTGQYGMKGDNSFLKFVLTKARYNAVFDIGLKKNKIKKVSPEQLQRDLSKDGYLTNVDFKKLYQY